MDDFVIVEHEWPPEQAIMDTLKPVEGCFTSIRVKLEPGFRAYRRDNTIRSADIYDVIGSPVFPDLDEYGVLYFVDQFPKANWAHRCTYILLLCP